MAARMSPRLALASGRLAFAGGRTCLDLCNTGSRRRGRVEERLDTYSDLVGWAWRVGILNSEEASRLARLGARNPTAALAVWERAVRLRAALVSVFGSLAVAGSVPAEALDVLNDELAGAMARSQVVPTETGFTWLWAEGGKALDCMLWPIARSAADLLTTGPLGCLRRCEGEDCGWLFLDTSRNGTRRWCDMRICGNRAKARRHHRRVRAGAA